MALVPISAVDAVSPALDRMRQMLFRPVRLGLWLRLFLVGLLTGELSSAGGGLLQAMVQLPRALVRASGRHRFLAPASALNWAYLSHFLPLVLILLLLAVVITLIFLYLATVFRFVLLEAVINGQVRLGQSFRRWQRLAGSLFVLRIWIMLLGWAVTLPLVAWPLLRLWRAGFRLEALRPMLPMIAAILALLVVLSLLWLLVWLFIRDFAVPTMAIEDLSATQACRRVWRLLCADPGAYAGYVGMKIVLAIAAGMLSGLVVLIVIFVLLLPAVLLFVLGFIGSSMAGHALAIALGITLLIVFVLVILVVGSALGVAVMVFFQAYTVRFFAGRYAPLAATLFPEAPPAPAPAPEA